MKILYKHYMLLLLTMVAAYNYVDRLVLSLLLEDIKAELTLSDTQLGLLTGIAFSLFYAIAAIPIARWADRGNRNTIVSLTTLLWSGMVSICGMVTSFAQLLLVRVGVAVGEAGCLPPAQSLITEQYDRAERPRAMAIYWLCYPIAVIFGYLAGGWLAERFGWRDTFILMGLPGILLALIVKLTLREPRLNKDPVSDSANDYPSFKEVLVTLWQEVTFRYIVIAFCVGYFFATGLIQWLPTFFIRSHAMSVSELGTWFAISWGVFGLLGGYIGGMVTTQYAAKNESLQMRAIAVICVINGFLFVAICLSPNPYTALSLLCGVGFLANTSNGAVFSAIQSLVNDRMRSTAIALVFFIANLIGLGLGPVSLGALSDFLAPTLGEESLRYSLALFSPGYLVVAFYYWRASTTIAKSISNFDQSEVHLNRSA